MVTMANSVLFIFEIERSLSMTNAEFKAKSNFIPQWKSSFADLAYLSLPLILVTSFRNDFVFRWILTFSIAGINKVFFSLTLNSAFVLKQTKICSSNAYVNYCSYYVSSTTCSQWISQAPWISQALWLCSSYQDIPSTRHVICHIKGQGFLWWEWETVVPLMSERRCCLLKSMKPGLCVVHDLDVN